MEIPVGTGRLYHITVINRGDRSINDVLQNEDYALLCDRYSVKRQNIKSYMLHEIKTDKGQWIKMVNHYRDTLGMSWEEMKEIEKKDLKKRVKEYDTREWKEGIMNKEALKWYRKGKDSIGYEMCYSKNKLHISSKS